MESYKKIEINSDNNNYTDYDFRTNNLGIQKENERKFDILLNGILANNKTKCDNT